MDIEQIRREALKECAEQFELIDHTALKNTQKVLEAFKEARLSAIILPDPVATDTAI